MCHGLTSMIKRCFHVELSMIHLTSLTHPWLCLRNPTQEKSIIMDDFSWSAMSGQSGLSGAQSNIFDSKKPIVAETHWSSRIVEACQSPCSTQNILKTKYPVAGQNTQARNTPTQNTQSPKIPKVPKIPKPKIPKAKIPKVPKYPRLK